MPEPGWVTDGLLHPYPYLPDDDLGTFPPLDMDKVEGLMWHSGSVGRALGEYTTDEPDGRCVAYHFPWFDKTLPGSLAQSVPLDVRAYHAGRGNCWWGAGLPGPASQLQRPEMERRQAQGLVLTLQQAFPRFKYWCRHSDIDKSRHDPGVGFLDDWMLEVGMEWKIPPGCRLVRR